MEKRLYTAAVFASFAWNNRIPVEFSWNWKETAVCRNRPIFLLRSLRYKLETERFSIRSIYFNAMLDTFPMIKISPCPTIEISHQSVLRARGFLESSLLFLSFRSEFTRNRETSKSCARSKASSAPHQSLNRKRSRAVCRPIWRTSIFLPGYLPPRSTNHDSILDLARDFFPVQGSRAAIQGWKNRADGLDRCRSS